MPQISASVNQEIVDAIDKFRENNDKKIKKVVPTASELSFSEVVATLLSTHPEVIKLLSKK